MTDQKSGSKPGPNLRTNENSKNKGWNISFKTFRIPLVFLVIFYGVAFWRFFATGKIFYIYNFIYLGSSLALGIFLSDALPKKYVLWGRRITQFLIGIYMIVFVGILRYENMQIEGFFFYLLMGVFAGATLHYFLAKIVGPLVFNRGWCGWACWTAMILDFLPWKRPKGRIRKLGLLRYLHFFLSLGVVLFFWFVLEKREMYSKNIVEIYWLAVGNIAYYLIGIVLAITLKDNRAFCKYICPIPVFQKITSRFSLAKIKIDSEKCNGCGLCEKSCPMNIELLQYKEAGTRILSTECILCVTCANICPRDAVSLTFRPDAGRKEFIRYKTPRKK